MNPYAEALAWALVHFVWQGAALALVSFLLIRWLKPSANGRYAIGVATLAAMLASPAVTFIVLAGDQAAVSSPPAASLTPGSALDASFVADGTIASAVSATPGSFNATAALLGAWLMGVVVFSLRLAGGWMVARRMLTQAVRPVAPDVALLARRVAARLALDRAFRVVESSTVTVPVMAGWLKPVILLPAVALSGLTPTQVEALLAHELAHVRRHDYIVNLVQAAVETLLFYHPAVWWVSKQVRAERENCCDDLAVGVCDRLVYVSALTDLAAMSVPRTALAATGGSLLARVQRLLGRRDETSRGGGWIGVLVALLTLGALAPSLSAGIAPRDSASQRRNPTLPAVIEETKTEATQTSVQGGVPTGVRAGVPTGVAQGEPADLIASLVFQSSQQEQERIRERERQEVRNIEEQRRELDRRKVDLEAGQQLEKAKVQLQEAQARLERSRQLVEQNLMSKDELIKAEVQMRDAEQRMVAVQQEFEIRKGELGLSQRYSAEFANMRARMQELESARTALVVAAAENPQEAARLKERMEELQRQLDELKRAIAQMEAERVGRKVTEAREVTGRAQEERLKELGLAREQMARTDRERLAELGLAQARRAQDESERLKELGLARERAATDANRLQSLGVERDRRLTELYASVTDPKEPIKAGDLLIVEISGETELPKSYRVGENGTVRLPLLGQIKVAGLTVQQAGQAISKQVSRVNSSATVHVSLRRPNRESRRQQ